MAEVLGRNLWIAVAGLGLALGLSASGARAGSCEALAHAALRGAVVTSAQEAAAGTMVVPAGGGSPEATVELPAFCRVKGIAADSIGYEVWLPAAGWNGRLLSVGNGGFGGAILFAGLADGLGKGYAVTGNDTGHQGDGRAWMRERAKVRLWGHSATHLATDPAKAIILAYYGRRARYAYFIGCSTGGAQAMEEAEFFPKDYDGVVAGSPGMSYAHLMLSFLWGLKAADHPGGLIPPEKLRLLNRAVLDACDAEDGVIDGLISDPLACKLDLQPMTCAGADRPDCLTPAQIQTARLIYQGPRNPRTGASIYPGFAYGSESSQDPGADGSLTYGWNAIQGPLAQRFAIPLLRDMVYQDPNWDWRRFDWDRDVDDLDRRIGADITAVNPDLSAFAKRKGRLIIYQGWGDPLNAQTLPIEYRAQVISLLADGGDPVSAARKADGFMRVFMAPGMAHCMGGPGPNKLDPLSALTAWVEQGRSPERLIATRALERGETAALSRPLCAFPKTPRLTAGDTRSAASFACVLSKPELPSHAAGL